MKLIHLKDLFYLMESKMISKICVLGVSLLIRRAKISPAIRTLECWVKLPTAKYPLTRVKVKTFTIHAGIIGESIGNTILRLLPKRIIVGFIDNKAFNGNRKLNPFNSKNRNKFLFAVCWWHTNSPLQPNFSKDEPLYVEAYHTLFSGTGIYFLNEDNSISRDANGYSFRFRSYSRSIH